MEKELSKLIEQVSGLLDKGITVVGDNLPVYCKQVVEYQVFVNSTWLWVCVVFGIISLILFTVGLMRDQEAESSVWPFTSWIFFSVFAVVNALALKKLTIAPLVFLVEYLKRQIL